VIRVALQAPPAWAPDDAPDDARISALAQFLAERLSDCPGIELVDSERTGAFLDALRSDAGAMPDELLTKGFSATLPVDAIVLFSTGTDKRSVSVCIDGRAVQMPATIFTSGKITAFVKTAASFVAETLSLPQDACKRIAADPTLQLDDNAFATVFLNRRISASWPQNPGEARLLYLRPAWSRWPKEPRLAADVLEATFILLKNARRAQDYADKALVMANTTLPVALGAGSEHAEHAAENLVALRPRDFDATILDMCTPLLADPMDDLLDESLLPAAGDRDLGMLDAGSAALNHDPRLGAISETARLGALRLSGFLRSDKALAMLTKAASHQKTEIRRSAAVALGRLDGNAGINLLQKLTGDPDAGVVLCAAIALLDRGQAVPGDLSKLASDRLGDPVAPPAIRLAAARLLAALKPELVNAPSQCAPAADARLRSTLMIAWLRRAAVADAYAALQDVASPVVMAAILRFAAPATLTEDHIQRLIRLANDPHRPIAEAARAVLAGHRPQDHDKAIRFDLQVEHPYRRMRILDALASSGTPDAMAVVADATGNSDPHTRAHALALWVSKTPAASRHAVLGMLSDAHLWPRLQAASLVRSVAQPDDASVLRAALEKAGDPAITQYLHEALHAVGAAGRPEARPAARQVTTDKNLTWLCGMGMDAEKSPFLAYYLFTPPSDTGDWQRVYDAGKIFFIRYTPVSHPGLVVLDPAWHDRFWLNLNRQINLDHLPRIDGFVFGEETMSMDPDDLWDAGWRLFCQDTGLDPDRVKGDRNLLSAAEKQDWNDWASERGIEGFNRIYDYVKRRFGPLRPGIQVATFLPGESAPSGTGAVRWKFDVSGIYDYKGDNRMSAYSLVRRLRTLWPARPVIWLSLGIGGYEMNPVRRTQQVPDAPFFSRSNRAYTDSVTAWMAGAQPGWFSTWIFVDVNWSGRREDLKGTQVNVEDLVPGSPLLETAIKYAFRNAVNERLAPEVPASPGESMDGTVPLSEEDLQDLLEPGERASMANKAVAEDRDQFRRGFLFYGRYIYDTARLFKSLPPPSPCPTALGVHGGVTVWTRPGTPNPLIPGLAVLNEYDFLHHAGDLEDIDLARYQLIVLRASGPLTGRVVAALQEWLRHTPGVLIVNQAVESGGAISATDWPWKDALEIRRSKPVAKGKSPLAELVLSPEHGNAPVITKGVPTATFAILQPANALPLLRDASGEPVLLLWQHPDFKGQVLFDGIESADAAYLNTLRDTLNTLHRDKGLGIPVEGPLLQQTWQDQRLTAAAATRYYNTVGERTAYPGLDLLSGFENPPVGAGSSAAILARGNFMAGHVAAVPGLNALGDAPFDLAEPEGSGLRLRNTGLFRVSAGTQGVAVTAVDGTELPPLIKDVDAIANWLASGQTPGIAVLQTDENRQVTYIRSDKTLLVAPAPPP
jgi:hypothetical protein